jgi:GT2 family glycosyltransferase
MYEKFLSPASFWAPHFVTVSAWVDHAPFAFWVVGAAQPRDLVELGTHGGYSFFAFCQSVAGHGLSTRCFAVDTFQGDEHAGFYDQEVFQRVWKHNEAHYAAFSRLVQSTFDGAVGQFADGSIDLLHMDGRHFYDNVKHDFETWLPKLSDRAVVLLHDINVRERDFGVARLWDELKATYPSFAFNHGHGLGVLAVGKAQSPAMAAFFEAVLDAATADAVRAAYARLGGALKADYSAAEAQARMKGRVAEAERQTAAADARAAAADARAAAAAVHVAEAESRMAGQEESFLERTVMIRAANDAFREENGDLNRHIKHLNDVMDEMHRKQGQIGLELAQSRQEVRSLLQSSSWRLTAPIRTGGVVARRVVASAKVAISQVARFLYRRTPLSKHVKRAIADAVLKVMEPLVRNTSTYRLWRIARRFEAPNAPPTPPWLRARGTFWEVARAANEDFSAAVPFQYPITAPVSPPRIAAIVHVFYDSMAPEVRRYLGNVPFPLDVFITTDAEAKKETIAGAFRGWASGSVEVRVVENRGRDIAPKLVGFKDVYPKYDYVIHLHTKWSDHASALAHWRGHIYENLLGSPDIVRSIFEAFARTPDLGLIAAQHFELISHWINWGGNLKPARMLAKRMGFDFNERGVLDFPSGSMFWARTAALKPLLDLDLTFADFPREERQIDGTLAHAIERLYFHVCERAGFRWMKIAHPALFTDASTVVPVVSQDGLTEFLARHGVSLADPKGLKPRPNQPWALAVAPAGLRARLQTTALGLDRVVAPSTKVFVGVVTYKNTALQLGRIVGTAERALNHAGLATKGRVLILDNGDPSDALTGVRESITRLPPKGNVGFGGGHNAMMAQAFADGADIYIAANPDGAFHPDAIAAIGRMMAANANRALIEALQFPVEHSKVYDPFTFETPWVSGACLAVPRALYDEIGGFDDAFFMYCEDVDLSWRARAAGFAVRVCPRALFMHAVTNRSQSPRIYRLMLESGVTLARKWGDAEFERWVSGELTDMAIPLPTAAFKPVPPAWRRVADFSSQFSFGAIRW